MEAGRVSPFHPFKAVAIDLDGTLLDHELRISPENRAAIERLHEAGLQIILASGRHHISMLPIARQLPQVEWMVSAQGSFAANLDRTKVLYDSHLDPAKAAYVIDIGERRGYSVIVYARSGIFALDESEWIDYYVGLAGVSPFRVDKERVLQESIFKVVLLGDAARIEAALSLPEVVAWDLYKVRSLKNIFEFAGLGTSKAHGLRPLLEHLGITPEELVTFGDAPNDVPMFQMSGYSFAMDHGWDDAKSAAREIAPDGPQATSFARAVAALEARCRVI